MVRVGRIGLLVFALAAVATAGWFGVELRARFFAESSAYRMRGDIMNAWNHGSAVLREARRDAGLGNGEPLSWPQFWRGYVGMYDKVAARGRDLDSDHPRFALDYSPIRLAIMSAWMKHVTETWPDARRYDDRYAWPLMHLNTAMSGAAALAMFATVAGWLRRCRRETLPSASARLLGSCDWPWIAGAIAALLCWFNPSTILDSHGFGQWDVWILPFVIAAMGLAAVDRWGWAGAMLGLSMGFKGQALMVAPVFVFWPLLRLRFGAIVRLIVGFALLFLLQGSPWLVPGVGAWLWAGGIVGISMVMTRRISWLAVSSTAIVAILACAVRFGGSWNWLVISYLFPTYQYSRLAMGSTSNLPALLSAGGWELNSPALWGLTLRQLLVTTYVLALVLCAVAAASAHRRREPRLLLALATPWVLMFALMPQMHERYLVWGAAVGSVAVAVSPGAFLLQWIIVAQSSLMIFQQMLRVNPRAWPQLSHLLEQTHPGLAWMLLLAAGTLVYASFAPVASLRVSQSAAGNYSGKLEPWPAARWRAGSHPFRLAAQKSESTTV